MADPRSKRRVAISVASLIFFFTGVAGLSAIALNLLSILNEGVIPAVFGMNVMGGSVLESIGYLTWIMLGILLLTVSSLEIIVGTWLWESLRKGGILGLIIIPIDLFLSVIFVLPIWLILHLFKVILMAVGWRTLR